MAEALITSPNIGTVVDPNDPSIKIFGIRIDMASSDPSSAVIYTDDAVNFEPLACANDSNGLCSYGGWSDVITKVIGCKPCLYKDGARVKYLNPNNYAYDTDGDSVDITSGNAGDVMIEFKHLWYQLRQSGNYLYFKITEENMQGQPNWVDTAFASENGGASQEFMYYSAYEGWISGNKMYSLSGKQPTVNITIGTARNAAVARGSKYQQEVICKRTYIGLLLMLVTKNRDAQVAIGLGKTYASNATTTGTRNTSGLFAGGNNGNNVAKVFGIENFWGNFWHWCDGIVTAGDTNVKLKMYGPYNDSGSGYTQVGGLANSGWIMQMGTFMNGAIILPTAVGGGETTYFADYWSLNTSAGSVCLVGGFWNSGRNAGPWYCHVNASPSNTNTSIGCRLVAA